MPYLERHTSILIHGDASLNSNPRKRYVDWLSQISGLEVTNPRSDKFELVPGETSTIFSGTRSLGIDNTTEFEITLTDSSLYRITRTAGTQPAFRTNRNLTLNTEEVTVTLNNNAVATFALDDLSLGTFAAVSVGDWVFIPGPTTGDSTTVFNTLNEGFWVVLAKGSVNAVANKSLTLARLTGEDFEAVAETVTLTSNDQLIAFSASGVQRGDTVKISSGFSSITQQSFIITDVTPTWIEFISTSNLPLEEDILPTASGLVIYSDAKRFLRVEADQPCIVRLNGDTGNTNELEPRAPGDETQCGYLEKWGPVWSLVIVNKSTTSTLNVYVITAE